MHKLFIRQEALDTVQARAVGDCIQDIRPHNKAFQHDAYRFYNINSAHNKDNWFADWVKSCDTTGVYVDWDYSYGNELSAEQHKCVAVLQVGNFDRLVYFISEITNNMSATNSCATLYGMFLERSTTPVPDSNLEAVVYMKESWLLVLPNLNTSQLTDASAMPTGEH